MNYPIWNLPTIGGGTLIALIAVLHVYISHLAVGGGAFIWLTDLKSVRENSAQWRSYVKRHTWFFLLLTMVFGGISGVGIWFIISLVNPAATSSLIHSFVFGWAIEWVFFVGEIVSLLIYHYQFEKLSEKNRLLLAFFYFLFAWLSLVVINGILAFMLTPGRWLESGNFWHGFFNPSYFSSLFFRSAAMAMIAGLFGYVTAVFEKDTEFRAKLVTYCSKWLLLAFPFMVIFGIWYYYSIPTETRAIAFALNQQTRGTLLLMLVTSIIIFIGAVIFSLAAKRTGLRVLTFILLLLGLGWMAGFEYTREAARKPFVIHGFMYSTSIKTADVVALDKSGVLPSAKWSTVKDTKDPIAAGRELFTLECQSCHTVGGVRNDIKEKVAGMNYTGVLAQLTGMGKVNTYMPPFVGTDEEMKALAAYITTEINGREVKKMPEPVELPSSISSEVPPFHAESDDYVLLAWNDLGMHCISDGDKWFVFLPPANTLEAQLIKRGELPEVVTEDVEISYEVEEGFKNPAAHVDFWKYANSNFGVELEENIGLAGKGLSDTFDLNENGISFIASMVPVVPYMDDGRVNPYPLFTIKAVRKSTGELLATTKTVAPHSTEMGCRNCHWGDWAKGTAGVSDETASNILQSHDRLSGTHLYKKALKGQPQLCQSCHADPALGAEGKPEVLNLSAAMHGWHANLMPVQGSDACTMCHPAAPMGSTRCYRGLHAAVDVVCTDCHGSLQEHALALLRAEEEKSSTGRLMANLQSNQVASVEEINPRQPWLNEPDCLTCHVDFEKPKPGASAYNVWTSSGEELYRMRTSEEGLLRCTACHGSTHALYPAINPLDRERDNLQPLQYSGKAYPIGSDLSCKVCHKVKMEFAIHHENMERMVRNKTLRKLHD